MADHLGVPRGIIRGLSAAAEAGKLASRDCPSRVAPACNRGSSASAPAPREGLPPCVTIAVFDGRMATKVDAAAPCPYEHYPQRFAIGAGTVLGRSSDANNSHRFQTWDTTPVLIVLTDDPAEAEAAWERAERWVLTGELDEA